MALARPSIETIDASARLSDPSLRDVTADRIMGLTIIAVVPTIFWSAMITLGAWLFGTSVPFWVTCSVSLAMFTFLACLWSGFAVARQPGADDLDA